MKMMRERIQEIEEGVRNDDPTCMSIRATWYEHPLGPGEYNVLKAIDLYEKAASKGSVAAMNNLGVLYLYGKDSCPKNIQLARKWLSMAVIGGSESAKENLSELNKNYQN
jgi:TPR repeat protein